MLTLSGAGQPQNGGAGIEERFVISVKTDNAGTSLDNEFTLPWIGTYDIEWGDGNKQTGVTDSQTHTYNTSGTYEVKVKATTGQIFFARGNNDRRKLLDITNWGTCAWTTMDRAFSGCEFLEGVSAMDIPNFTNCTNTGSMFSNSVYYTSGKIPNLANWDVSSVTYMQSMFEGFKRFNSISTEGTINFSNWDFSKVTRLRNFATNSPARYGIMDCTNIDLSSLTDGYGAFRNVTTSNVGSITLGSIFPSIGLLTDTTLTNTDISSVSNFYGAFSGNDLSGITFDSWDFSHVIGAREMFSNCTNIPDVTGLDVSGVSNFQYMFSQSPNFNQDISVWDVSSSGVMRGMFQNAVSFDRSLANWDIDTTTDFRFFMSGATLSTQNYNATLISWAAQNVSLNESIDFGNSQYTYEGASARQSLIDDYGWTITDGGLVESPEFVISINTENISSGSSDLNQFKLPIQAPSTINSLVDWGDGTSDMITSYDQPEIKHTYSVAGEYTIKMNGVVNGWRFNNTGDRNKLLYVLNWGVFDINIYRTFQGCANFNSLAIDSPTISTNNLNAVFYYCDNFNGYIDNWDVSGVTSIEKMFLRASSFNQDISSWNTSNITNMFETFRLANSFNQSLNSWDVSSVTNMGKMFWPASSFNQPLDSWDVSNVSNMGSMLEGCTSFDQPLNSWDVSNVVNMSKMFQQAKSFNQDITNWDVSSVTNMNGMFNEAYVFSQDITNWNTSNVTNMGNMFSKAYEFVNNVDVVNLDISSVTRMQGMFSITSFNQDITSWDTSNVTDMGNMFQGTPFNQAIGSWNVANVTSMSSMFSQSSFNQPIGNWNVGNVTSMSNMFNTSPFNQDVSGWNVSSVTNMSVMFQLTQFNQDISNWDVSSLVNTKQMFNNSPFNQNINNWNVSSLQNMSRMFERCFSFKQSLEGWNILNVTNASDAFRYIDINEAGTTTNYDNTLIGWASQSLQSGVTFKAGTSQYSLGGAAEAARNTLINTYGWTITDGGGVFVGLLDTYPNASAAYSLRDLASASVGSAVVRIRRSSDNLERDITSAEITDGTLETFVGANDGFVTTWYDQSGNSKHATQSTALYQRILVTNGVLNTYNGKPCDDYVAGSRAYNVPNDAYSAPFTYFMVAKPNVINSDVYQGSSNNSTSILSNNLTRFYGGNFVDIAHTLGLSQIVTYALFNGASSEFQVNDITPITTGDIGTSTNVQANSFGFAGYHNNSGQVFTGKFQEMIIYTSDKSTYREGVIANINTEYTIYEVPVSGLLFDYPDSSAAYSLRQLTTFESGNEINLVRVRRSNDNTEQDFTATEITDGTLTTFTGANDGFVTTWYDQSGNSNNSAQATATTQPKLVSSGVVILDNGLPAIDYDASGSDYLSLTSRISDVRSVFQIWNAETNTGVNTQFVLGDTSSYNYHGGTTGNRIFSVNASPSVYNGANYINSLSENFMNFDRPIVQCLVSMIHLSSTNKVNQLTRDRSSNSRSWQGKMQEIILYSTDETSNLQGINENLNDHYNIYEYRGNIVGGLLFDYPTSNGAYSLRNLAEYDNGFWPVIRIRRSNDNVEQDIFATDITDGTLESFIGVGNDGFVTKWYNQIPTLYGEQPNDASQTTAIKQPKLVSNGVVITDNGKPALFYDTTGVIGLTLLYDFNNINSVFQVLRTTSTTGNTTSLILGTTRPQGPYNYLSGASGQWLSDQYTKAEIKNGSNYLNDSLTNMVTTVRTTNQYLLSMIHTAAVGEVGYFSYDRSASSNRSWQGYMQEIILYPTDQTTNRDAIKTNINTEYTIY